MNKILSLIIPTIMMMNKILSLIIPTIMISATPRTRTMTIMKMTFHLHQNTIVLIRKRSLSLIEDKEMKLLAIKKNKKKEVETYHKGQKDEITRHPKTQDSGDDSTDEEIKKPISKSRYAVRNLKKIEIEDNENGNDSDVNDLDDNISDSQIKNDDYY